MDSIYRKRLRHGLGHGNVKKASPAQALPRDPFVLVWKQVSLMDVLEEALSLADALLMLIGGILPVALMIPPSRTGT
jgi:hypothetical protein